MPIATARAVTARGADPERETERLLLQRLASADPGAALDQLYDRFGPSVYRLGLRALGDAQLAEDVVQETFVRLWRSAPRFDPRRGSASTWVFTIARRVAIDLHRRRPPSGLPLPEDLHARDDALDRLLTSVTVREALEALSPDHRQVLELAYDGGLTQASIAERLGLPVGTVKSRTYHAMRALRDQLDERGIDA